MKWSTFTCAVFLTSACFAADPAAPQEGQPATVVSSASNATQAGLLMISMDAAPDVERLNIRLNTHAKLLYQPAIIDQALKVSPKLLELPSLKRVVAAGNDPVRAIRSAMLVEVVPDSLLIRIELASPDIITPADAGQIIQAIGDVYIDSIHRAESARLSNEMEIARQWRDRYVREISRAKEQINDMAVSIASATEAISSDAVARRKEITSLESDLVEYRQMERQMSERITTLQLEMRRIRSELQWGAAPLLPR